MDDIVILAKSRWHLKAAIRELILVVHSLGLDLHQKKRFIGRIDNGFDFLGYRIHPSRKLRPSTESLQRLVTRARRLYEQGADGCRLRQYVARWTCWLWGGLEALVSRKGGSNTTRFSSSNSCRSAESIFRGCEAVVGL